MWTERRGWLLNEMDVTADRTNWECLDSFERSSSVCRTLLNLLEHFLVFLMLVKLCYATCPSCGKWLQLEVRFSCFF